MALVNAAGKGEKKAHADALPVTVLQALDTVTVSVDGFRVPLEVDLPLTDYLDVMCVLARRWARHGPARRATWCALTSR